MKLKFFRKMTGDFEDMWVEGRFVGLPPSVNNGHIVLRSNGAGNGFAQTRYVRTNLVSPEHPSVEFVGSSFEQEYAPPCFRVRGKQGSQAGQPNEHSPARSPEGLEHVEPPLNGEVTPAEWVRVVSNCQLKPHLVPLFFLKVY